MRNSKGKEYGSGEILEFEGHYLNGKRNGIGKEYDCKGKLKCRGEYKDNKLWNIKRYDKNNKIINEIINGKGFFKEYDAYNNLIFEGEYLNGVRNGKGKEYNEDGLLIFEGEYL